MKSIETGEYYEKDHCSTTSRITFGDGPAVRRLHGARSGTRAGTRAGSSARPCTRARSGG